MAATPSKWNAAVDVAATIGEYSALFSLILGIIVGIILIIVGFVLILKSRKTGQGVILIVIAFLMIAFSYIYYIIVMSNKSIAAIAGVATVADIIGGGLRRKNSEKI